MPVSLSCLEDKNLIVVYICLRPLSIPSYSLHIVCFANSATPLTDETANSLPTHPSVFDLCKVDRGSCVACTWRIEVRILAEEHSKKYRLKKGI